jgi:hypothetical protein
VPLLLLVYARGYLFRININNYKKYLFEQRNKTKQNQYQTQKEAEGLYEAATETI